MKNCFMKSAVCACMMVGILLTGGCGKQGGQLPEGFDRTTVETTAKQVIENLNSENYEAVYEQFDETMQRALPPEALESQVGVIVQAKGKFLEYSAEEYTGAEDKQTKKDYAVAILSCEYESGNLVYTISIDAEGKVGGLYVK